MFRLAEKSGKTVRELLGVAEPAEGLHPVELWWWSAYYAREPQPTAKQIAMLIGTFRKKKWQDFMPVEFVDYDMQSEIELRLGQDHQRMLGRQLEQLRKTFRGGK